MWGRRVAFVLLGLGLCLVAAPVVSGITSKAPRGAAMLADFSPLMTREKLDGFGTDLDTVDAAVRELDAADSGRLSPGYAAFSAQWPTIHTDLDGLFDQVADHRTDYEAVAGLPDFRLLPWFFLVPGALVAGAAAVVLVRGRWTAGPRSLVALAGIALIAVPVASGMFSRAPAGARMMDTFATLETSANVQRIQGYFSTMAVGQGAIRLDLVPAWRRAGLDDDTIAERYPRAIALNDGWVRILNEMTPMIGAMSDNVDRYQAIASLPGFALFPWFFLLPGLLLLGGALMARTEDA